MNARNVDPPSWLVSVRHFLGFDPAAAVGDGIRRGWIVPALVREAPAPTPEPALPDPDVSRPEVSPIDAAVRAAVAELGKQTVSREFLGEEVRFHPAVLALRPAKASVRTYLQRMIAEGTVAVVSARSGPRPAVYRAL